jgi:hypothetical protein
VLYQPASTGMLHATTSPGILSTAFRSTFRTDPDDSSFGDNASITGADR